LHRLDGQGLVVPIMSIVIWFPSRLEPATAAFDAAGGLAGS
jgi:hypothetical protein